MANIAVKELINVQMLTRKELSNIVGGDGVPTVKPGSNRCTDFACKWQNAKDFVGWLGRKADEYWPL